MPACWYAIPSVCEATRLAVAACAEPVVAACFCCCCTITHRLIIMAFDWVGPDLVFGGMTTLLIITGILSLKDAAAGALGWTRLPWLLHPQLRKARIPPRSPSLTRPPPQPLTTNSLMLIGCTRLNTPAAHRFQQHRCADCDDAVPGG